MGHKIWDTQFGTPNLGPQIRVPEFRSKFWISCFGPPKLCQQFWVPRFGSQIMGPQIWDNVWDPQLMDPKFGTHNLGPKFWNPSFGTRIVREGHGPGSWPWRAKGHSQNAMAKRPWPRGHGQKAMAKGNGPGVCRVLLHKTLTQVSGSR